MNERQNPLGAPTFREFMDGCKERTLIDKMLIQAMAIISVQDGFTHMTPEEVYQRIVDQVVIVHSEYD